jgi:hypothetical protein
VSFY